MTVVGNLKVQEYIQNIRIFNLVLLKSHKTGNASLGPEEEL